MYEVKGLTKAIKEEGGERLLFDDLSFSLPDVGLFVLLGRSGEGKSTLLHFLALLEPSKGRGSLLFGGVALEKLSASEKSRFRQEHFGFLFQHYHLEPSLTAFENVLLPLLLKGLRKDEAEAKAKEKMKALGLLPLADRFAGSLSGGEKARVAFLRATVAEPRILFGDEPTGALDPKNGELLLGEIKAYARKHLVFIVTHDATRFLPLADGAFLLKAGRLETLKKPRGRRKKKEAEPREGIKKRKSAKALFALIERRFRKRFLKQNAPIFLSSLSLAFSFFLTIGLLHGGSLFAKEGELLSLLAPSASVSIKEKIHLEGSPFSLERGIRPEKEDLLRDFRDIETISFHNDYSYFFPSSLPYTHRGFPSENVSFHPVWDLSLKGRSPEFLVRGALPKGTTLDYVLVNEEMAKRLGEEPVGELLEVAREVTFPLEGEEETIRLSYRFEVLGVVRDFAFLSLPRVFYSYPAFEERMRSTEVRGKSLASLVEDADPSSSLSSRAYLAFFGEKDLSRIRKAEKGSYALENIHWQTHESFLGLWDLLSKILYPFLALETVLIALGILYVSQRSFLENRHFAALLYAFGMEERESAWLFGKGGFLALALGTFLALGLSILLSPPLSTLLEARFGLSNLLVVPYGAVFGVPGFLFLAASLFVFLLYAISIRLPFFVLSHKGIAKELKDE